MSTQTPFQHRDPFYVRKEQAQQLQSKLAVDFNEWKDALSNTNTANNPTFGKMHRNLKISLKQLNAYLHDLQETIVTVSQNRHKFTNITEAELDSRKKYVTEAKASMKSMKSERSSARTKGKMEKDRSAALMSKQSTTAFERSIQTQNDDLIHDRKQQQMVVEVKQDVVLEDMSEALLRLGDVADMIGKEMTEQKSMLEETDQELNMAQSNMDIAMKKMEKLLGTSDRGRICCILLLIAIAGSLFVAVLY